ncbi:MAG: MiaB/RimO family radical SAM methylthiotransferase [Desulfovibrionaceae bacterium]|nr:MiaB/RimO family radical SAM methylthiotransferase [Desulfovibrionaceae bacterium]
MRKFYAQTLGCKVNQYETQAICEAWTGLGLVRTQDPAEADLVLVNSCAVTARAVADLRRAVRRINRLNPASEILVTGCAAEVAAEGLEALPGVFRVVPQSRKKTLLGCAPNGANQDFGISDYPRARAVVLVQDGCSHACSYCVVPRARGPSRSRPGGAVLVEINRLLAAGFRELVVCGVNLRQYGLDLPGRPDFWDLLSFLDSALAPRWAGRARLRLSSLEPGQLGAKALEVLASSDLVCRHLHLSLQSGDPGVLELMGRGHYRPEQAIDFLDRLRDAWPVFGLGADILVGFPGEDEQGFENTCAFCRLLPLTYAHVFPFSPRPGTRAQTMPDQVPDPVRRARAKRLRDLAGTRKRAFAEALAGLPEIEVLVQDESGLGLCSQYAACRITSAGPAVPKTLVRARPAAIEAGLVLAEAAGS